MYCIVVKINKVYLYAFPCKDLQNTLSGKSQVQYNTDCTILLHEHTQTTRTKLNRKKVITLWYFL